MVSGSCKAGSGQVDEISLVNGNCTPMGDAWELITTNAATKSIKLPYCFDQSCSNCLEIIDYQVVKFVDCTTTPTYRYTTTSDPESAIIAQLGGMVYGNGDTYDNCTITLKKSFVSANACISTPLGGSTLSDSGQERRIGRLLFGREVPKRGYNESPLYWKWLC